MPPDDQPDELADACDELARYMAILELLVAEPVALSGGAAPGLHGRQASPPLPGHQQALFALTTAHEGLRRLESALHEAVFGEAAAKRGGSGAATRRILEQLPKLAATIDDGNRDLALCQLGKWISEAKAVHGIDEAPRWRRLPRWSPRDESAGPDVGLPPRCPRCRTYNLRVDVEQRLIACSLPGCRDRNGVPPVATYGRGEDGRPRLYWADGLIEIAPEIREGA